MQPSSRVFVGGRLAIGRLISATSTWPPLAPSPPVVCRVGHNPEQPCPEPATTVKIPQCRKRLEHRLLNHVECILLVP